MTFNVVTNVPIPSGRGSYNFDVFTAAGQAAFVPAEDRGKKAASIRASARRYTEEKGVEFVIRAGEDGEGKPGVWVWRTTEEGKELPVLPQPPKGKPGKKPGAAKK